MKLINYSYKEEQYIGIIEKNEIIPLEKERYASIQGIIEENCLETLKHIVNKYRGKKHPLNQVTVSAPIPRPKRNLFCLGKNYKAHALEMKGKTSDAVTIPDQPIYFSKVASPAIGHKDMITGHVGLSEKLDYEVELAVIIGQKGINITKETAKDHIFGYTICNDVSARDLQVKHVQWHRGKSLDGFCPMGPVVVTRDEIPYPPTLKIVCKVNGEIRQEGITSDLIFDIDTIISDLSKGMTLYPGDVILTGTPSGVGMGFEPPKFLKSGDVIECEIEKIGLLENIVK